MYLFSLFFYKTQRRQIDSRNRFRSIPYRDHKEYGIQDIRIHASLQSDKRFRFSLVPAGRGTLPLRQHSLGSEHLRCRLAIPTDGLISQEMSLYPLRPP
jgi:hypothetical protein